ETDAQLIANYRVAPDEVYDADGNLVREDAEKLVEHGISLTFDDEFGWRICEVREVAR
ncbi:MAG: hypothetical protein GY778_10465, partial [bacterium]|nr:hypothetical protein [bacterium]